MAQKLMTPGVYIEEINAFPGSVVEVATAIPAFIGYTQKASRNGKSISKMPTRITSLSEYRQWFGGPAETLFELADVNEGEQAMHEITIGDNTKEIKQTKGEGLYMYRAMQLFFDNGGGACYVVSVGTYKTMQDVKKEELVAGIDTLLKEQEPTMVLVPDAIKLGDESYDVYKKALAHCAKMQSRVAIVDLWDGYSTRVNTDNVDIIDKFREKIGTENLSYAAAYYPWMNTSIVQKGEIDFQILDPKVELGSVLTEKAAKPLINDFPKDEDGFKNALIKERPDELAAALTADNPADIATVVEEGKLKEGITAETLNGLGALPETEALLEKFVENKKRNFHLGLIATSPTYSDLLDEIRAVMNILPPSSALAGIYTAVDNSRGVWKSPANISLNSVVKPTVNITHDEQENLNVDAISGKSINAIRTFPGIGTLVWGARTLDGNSLDWKYINVRRTMIMLEQSIKLALRSYVFEPNDANTWITVKSMIVNFLTEKWKQGALAGASPDDAFEVQVGLGSTMTALDILEGKMLITVKLAIVRPAEFIVVTFEQQMQKS